MRNATPITGGFHIADSFRPPSETDSNLSSPPNSRRLHRRASHADEASLVESELLNLWRRPLTSGGPRATMLLMGRWLIVFLTLFSVLPRAAAGQALGVLHIK